MMIQKPLLQADRQPHRAIFFWFRHQQQQHQKIEKKKRQQPSNSNTHTHTHARQRREKSSRTTFNAESSARRVYRTNKVWIMKIKASKMEKQWKSGYNVNNRQPKQMTHFALMLFTKYRIRISYLIHSFILRPLDVPLTQLAASLSIPLTFLSLCLCVSIIDIQALAWYLTKTGLLLDACIKVRDLWSELTLQNADPLMCSFSFSAALVLSAEYCIKLLMPPS